MVELLPQLHHSWNRCKEISLPKVSIQEGNDWRKQRERRKAEVRVGARGQSGSCFSWDVANLVAVRTQEMSWMLLLLLFLLFPFSGCRVGKSMVTPVLCCPLNALLPGTSTACWTTCRPDASRHTSFWADFVQFSRKPSRTHQLQ